MSKVLAWPTGPVIFARDETNEQQAWYPKHLHALLHNNFTAIPKPIIARDIDLCAYYISGIGDPVKVFGQREEIYRLPDAIFDCAIKYHLQLREKQSLAALQPSHHPHSASFAPMTSPSKVGKAMITITTQKFDKVEGKASRAAELAASAHQKLGSQQSRILSLEHKAAGSARLLSTAKFKLGKQESRLSLIEQRIGEHERRINANTKCIRSSKKRIEQLTKLARASAGDMDTLIGRVDRLEQDTGKAIGVLQSRVDHIYHQGAH